MPFWNERDAHALLDDLPLLQFLSVEARPEIRSSLELQARHRHLQNFFLLYSPFARLPAAALTILLTELEVVTANPGALVIRQGDEPGPMYVVKEGRLRVFTQADGR